MTQTDKFTKRKQNVIKLFENYFKPEIFKSSWEKEGIQVSRNIYYKLIIDNI